jgi:hypothetical protein
VLVHDLQFTVASSDPAALAESIAAEGFLSDALGNYTISLDGGTPESLHRPPAQRRAGGLRPGAAWPAAPAWSPAMFYSHPVRRGEGVDLSREPAPAAEKSEAASGHDGHEDSGH